MDTVRDDMLSDSTPLYAISGHIQTRWASPENPKALKGAAAQTKGGRKGRPCVPLLVGEKLVLAEASGTSGVVRRMWVTISDRAPSVLRGLRIDIHWDGAASPAVSAPFGDFFGQSLGRCQTFSSALFSNPEGRSFNCSVPMPFRSGFKIVLTNESASNLDMVFYDINFTVGDKVDENMLYFHAHWRRENPTTIQRDYEFLPKVMGRGRFLGVNAGVIADTQTYFKSWWGEGEMKIYLDGDGPHPTLCGTGTEDYIGTAWGQGQYAHPYQGCPLADGINFQYAFYRYHLPDPIFFHHDLRVAMQQIGCCGPEHFPELCEAGRKLMINEGPEQKMHDLEKAAAAQGYILFERQDDWSSCCYFYLDRPESGLPPLAEVGQRIEGLISGTGEKSTLV